MVLSIKPLLVTDTGLIWIGSAVTGLPQGREYLFKLICINVQPVVIPIKLSNPVQIASAIGDLESAIGIRLLSSMCSKNYFMTNNKSSFAARESFADQESSVQKIESGTFTLKE